MAESMLSSGTMPLLEKQQASTKTVGSSGRIAIHKDQTKKVVKPPAKSAQVAKAATSSIVHAVAETPSSNMEIGLILKELNATMSKHGEHLQKLADRVDTLYDDSYYEYSDTGATGMDYDYYDDGTASQLSQFTGKECSESDSHSQCDDISVKIQGTTFKGLSDKFLLAEKVDSEVNDDLAEFVNSSFRNGVSEDRVSEISKEIYRPQNCDSLCKTRVNPGIWRLLKPQTQTDDAKMQSIQNHIVKASIEFVKLLDKNSESFDSQSVEWGTSALALLGQCNKLINNKRKESHKHDLDPKFYPLTSPMLPYTEYLYGNETDVNRNVKDIQDMSRIGKVGRNNNTRGRGNRGAPYRGRGTRRGRGRGFYNRDSGSSYPSKNYKEGQKK